MNIPGRVFEVGESVYSDWFPRGGDNILLRMDLIDHYVASGTVTISVNLYSKNQDEVGDGTIVYDSDASSNFLIEMVTGTDTVAEGVLFSGTSASSPLNGLLQMVRLKIAITASAENDGWINARIFPPVFFDSAKP